jgi:hypothetical protein
MIFPLNFLIQIEKDLHHCQFIIFSFNLLKLGLYLVQKLMDEFHLLGNLLIDLIVVKHAFGSGFWGFLLNMMA